MTHLTHPRFSRGEAVFVAIILAAVSGLFILSAMTPPDHTMLRKDRANQLRGIMMSLHQYAGDHQGQFPPAVGGNSTDTLQILITPEGLSDRHFYLPGNPGKRTAPNDDGKLEPHENCVTYVSGQSEATPIDSPLVADEMLTPGVYGKHHIFLRNGIAFVGYVGGQVQPEKLSRRSPGATVLGPSGSGMIDIFQVRGDGKLAASQDHMLLPQ